MSQLDSTYKIIKKIGSGGGGNVYLAQHIRLDKKVVLKIDKRKLTTSQDVLRREVDILKELSHPHIPRVYDFFIEDEKVYTAMDYIEGESLDKALKRGETFSQAQLIRWAVQILDALAYLHAPVHGSPPKGYVHSDIKPANLIRTPEGNICLIDFNVAGALGEKNAIGFSEGYASPEHYGLDFSYRYEAEDSEDTELTETMAAGEEAADLTETMTAGEGTADLTETMTMGEGVTDLTETMAIGEGSLSNDPSSSPGYYYSAGPFQRQIVVPDIRSDIYGVGATLYHLFGGKRPAKNAKEVIGLSEEKFNPQIVKIILKAMDPNRELRYQTAEEMKHAFLVLRENDPRMRRWRKCRRIAVALFPVFFLLGSFSAFAGLKRMQMTERWLKQTGYSREALEKGNVEEAIQDSLQVISESQEQWLPEHVPGIQAVLTEALGVYDLSDGFKMYKTIELPSAPLFMALSPDGKTGAALCGQTTAVFDTESGKVIAKLPVETSPISQIRYRDNDTLIYAGKGGITAYDIKSGQELWKGNAATSISISANGKRVAGIWEGDSFATVYDAETGEVRDKIDFGGRSQKIGIKDNLFALNQDGTLLGVSFQDGSLQIFDLEHMEHETVVFQNDSGYIHFEGGFSGKYLAFLAADQAKSTVAVIDTENAKEARGFQTEDAFSVQADESGIYVQSENILVKLDPVTGGQTPVAAAQEDILRFAIDGGNVAVTSDNEISFFDQNARRLSGYKKEYQSDLLCMNGKTAVLGSMDSPELRIMRYEENPETELFSYDPGYEHKEARISTDGETVMLFSFQHFCICDQKGTIVREVALPDSDHILDQQFIREDDRSYLEVTYDSGKADVYSAKDGTLLRQEPREKAAEDLDEEFLIGHLRIESPLHGTPVVYDVRTGKKISQLKEDTYLTYAKKAGDYIVAQYITADGYYSGQLLNEKCEVLADLPYLCDVDGETLIFDYPAGSIRKTQIYEVEELMERARGI